jgi:hypothetical protein
VYYFSSFLCVACSDPSLSSSSSWFGRLEASGWLGHVAKLLTAARNVVMSLHQDGKYSMNDTVHIILNSWTFYVHVSLVFLLGIQLCDCWFCFFFLLSANSVVVHGSASRDATLQVTSLAQVLLDSRCRTMQG